MKAAAALHTLRVNTAFYERAHGKRPSGRGSWAFCAADKYLEDQYLEHCFWATGTYGEAKRTALAHYAGQAVEVVVCT